MSEQKIEKLRKKSEQNRLLNFTDCNFLFSQLTSFRAKKAQLETINKQSKITREAAKDVIDEFQGRILHLEAERNIYRKACKRIRDKWVGGMAFHPTWEKQNQYIVRLAFWAIKSLTENPVALSEEEEREGS